ncbi:MAG TPA: hypothetical protein VKB03_10860 [Conexibacter sp.]|nr:hypothetical protein [Conexibacter sp.]
MTDTNGKSTREMLLETIEAHPGVTREGLIALTGLPSGAVDPSRIRLWEAGLIEPEGEAGWRAALANRIKTVRWRCVDDEALQADVGDRARARKKRNAEPSAEQMALEVVEALRNPTVNRLVQEMTKDGAGSRRAQREADKALRAQAMTRKREAAQVAQERTAPADFRKLLAHLWDARLAVGGIDSHLIRERARWANGEPRRISDADWAVALGDVRMIVKSLGAMWQNVRDLGAQDEPCPACGASQVDEERHLGAFVVEATAEEIADAEVVDAGPTQPL